ncbi:type II toxin-antitoxin system YoeB family toxin [Bacteroides xylanisolvens]|uniref:plasmid mobilization protein n=1 Tax=Bacteroides xylanisolvens TaxID=371601 RepID=UPI00125FAFCE|nr:type II toxin-antitoxin system YoeB family toxin [Bacteroides xylanisolvens]KAB6376410.1 type II toxin-antitoxin system YoeB family toxin [Bacteroides xylanisolvens]
MELRRNEKITFRCTELEKDALAEQAARCSLSVSEYCRSLSGLGHPEALRGGGDITWSRHITAHDRIIYDIYEEVVEVYILEVEGHYNDR